MTDKQSRCWCFTFNNWDEDTYEKIKNLKFKYLIIGKEIGKKCKTPHLQGYIEFANGKRLSTLKKINPKIH